MPQECRSCYVSSPDGAKFCAECGTPFAPAAEAAPAARPVSERRMTTVLFGDLVGFTASSESRDPEDVRELLASTSPWRARWSSGTAAPWRSSSATR